MLDRVDVVTHSLTFVPPIDCEVEVHLQGHLDHDAHPRAAALGERQHHHVAIGAVHRNVLPLRPPSRNGECFFKLFFLL